MHSDSTRNSFSAGTNIPNNVAQIGIAAEGAIQNPRRDSAAGNGILGCRDQAPKMAIQTRKRAQRPRSRELSCQKSPWKRPIWRRLGNVWFARAGWWAHQGSNLGPDD